MTKNKNTSLFDFIKIYQYDLNGCLDMVSSLQNWNKHTWYSSQTKKFKSLDEKELDVRDVVDCPIVFHKLMDSLEDAVRQYAADLLQLAPITALSRVRLNRYHTGSLMRAHADHIHSLFDGEAKGIPAVSLVGVLNDDYTGGDLVICGEPYRLQPGQIIAWPSCFLYPHEVTEITSGTRYSFVSWAW